MSREILVVRPLFTVTLPDEAEGYDSTGCGAAAPAYEANGVLLAKLAALIQKLVTNLPTLLPEILSILSLFGAQGTTPPANTGS